MSKIRIFGKCNPAIVNMPSGTYACTGDAWHKVPDGTTLQDIDFVPEFATWSTKWQPRYIDEYLLHKHMLTTNATYAYKWQLFCKQQYKLAFGVDLMTAKESIERWLSLKQLQALRHSQDIDALVGMPVKPIAYKIFGSKGNTHIVTLYPESMSAYCDCPGFMYRHSCKHINYLFNVVLHNKQLESECKIR